MATDDRNGVQKLRAGNGATHRFDATDNSAIRFSSSDFTRTREERRFTNHPFFNTLNIPSTLCVAVMLSVMIVGKKQRHQYFWYLS